MPRQFRLTDSRDGFTVVVSGDEPPDEATIASIIREQRGLHKQKQNTLMEQMLRDREANAPLDAATEGPVNFLKGALGQAGDIVGGYLGRKAEEATAPFSPILDEAARGNVGSAISEMPGAMASALSVPPMALSEAISKPIESMAELVTPGSNIAQAPPINTNLPPDNPLVKLGGMAINGLLGVNPAEQGNLGEALVTRSPKIAEKIARVVPTLLLGGKGFQLLSALGQPGQAVSILTGLGLMPTQAKELVAAKKEMDVRANAGDVEGAVDSFLSMLEQGGFLGLGAYGTGAGVKGAVREGKAARGVELKQFAEDVGRDLVGKERGAEVEPILEPRALTPPPKPIEEGDVVEPIPPERVSIEQAKARLLRQKAADKAAREEVALERKAQQQEQQVIDKARQRGKEQLAPPPKEPAKPSVVEPLPPETGETVEPLTTEQARVEKAKAGILRQKVAQQKARQQLKEEAEAAKPKPTLPSLSELKPELPTTEAKLVLPKPKPPQELTPPPKGAEPRRKPPKEVAKPGGAAKEEPSQAAAADDFNVARQLPSKKLTPRVRKDGTLDWNYQPPTKMTPKTVTEKLTPPPVESRSPWHRYIMEKVESAKAKIPKQQEANKKAREELTQEGLLTKAQVPKKIPVELKPAKVTRTKAQVEKDLALTLTEKQDAKARGEDPTPYVEKLKALQGEREAAPEALTPPPTVKGKGRYREELTPQQTEHAKQIADQLRTMTPPPIKGEELRVARERAVALGYKEKGVRADRVALAAVKQLEPSTPKDLPADHPFYQSDFAKRPSIDRYRDIPNSLSRVNDYGKSFSDERLTALAADVTHKKLDAGIRKTYEHLQNIFPGYLKGNFNGYVFDPHVRGVHIKAKTGERTIDLNLSAMANRVTKEANPNNVPLTERLTNRIIATQIHEGMHIEKWQHATPEGKKAFEIELKNRFQQVIKEHKTVKDELSSKLTNEDVTKLASMYGELSKEYNETEGRKVKSSAKGSTATVDISGAEGKEPANVKRAPPVGDRPKLAKQLVESQEGVIKEPPSPLESAKRLAKSEEGAVTLPTKQEVVDGLTKVIESTPAFHDSLRQGYQSTLASGRVTSIRNFANAMTRYGVARTVDAMLAVRGNKDAKARLKAGKEALLNLPGNIKDTAKMVKQGIIPKDDFNLNNPRIVEAQALERLMDRVKIPKQLKDQYLHLFASDIMTPGSWEMGEAPNLSKFERWTRILMSLNMTQERPMRLMTTTTELGPLMEKLGVKSLAELDAKFAKDPALAKAHMREVQGAIVEGLDLTAALRASSASMENITKGVRELPFSWLWAPFFNYAFNNYIPQVVEYNPLTTILSPRTRTSIRGYEKASGKLVEVEGEIKTLRGKGLKSGDPQLAEAYKKAATLRDDIRGMERRGIKTHSQVYRMAMTGPLVTTFAAAMRTLLGDDEKKKWYQVEVIPKSMGGKGETIDIRPVLGPLGLYWMLGDELARKQINPKKERKLDAHYKGFKEELESILNTRFGGAPSVFDLLSTAEQEKIKTSSWNQLTKSVAFGLGNVAGRFITAGPFGETIRDITAGIDPQEAVDRTFSVHPQKGGALVQAISGFGAGMAKEVPIFRSRGDAMLPRYDPTTGKPVKEEHPFLKLILGAVDTPNPVKTFLTRHRGEIVPGMVFPRQTHLDEFDERMYRYYSEGLEKRVLPIIKDDKLSEQTKVLAVTREMGKVKDEAKTSVLKQWLMLKRKGEETFELPMDEERKVLEEEEKAGAKKEAPQLFRARRAPVAGRLTKGQKKEYGKGVRELIEPPPVP